MEHFDVIVIGTGPAGQTAASELIAAGKQVAVTDGRAYGGTCSLRGCEPKKVLFAAAEVAERAAAQTGNGIAGSLRVDWPDLVEFKRTFTDPVSASVEGWLTGLGVTTLHGRARFIAPDAVEVAGAPYSADHFVVAVGALPIDLGIPGAEHVVDSEGFMARDRLADRIVFIGGGFISFEFAHIAAAAGAACTILHRSAQVLKGFDPELANMLADGYRARGIDVRTDAPVIEVRRRGAAYEVVCGDGTITECDLVVHGAGRVPDTAGLDLEAADVAFGPHGILVDSAMRSTSNPRVFAAGDAASSGAPLTPVAIAQARVAVARIAQTGPAEFNPVIAPSVVFSDPPLAAVGLTEDEARKRGLDVEVKLTETGTWASSRRVGQRVSGAKTIVEISSGRIVGAHLLGHGAEEVVNVFATAMLGGLSAETLKSAVWAYPTSGSEIVYLL
ncbi:MAG: NAD(P)/FAD-dependent oxidoreductase [Coriobacteriia bacterium]|nr:NAD(P)/FAD-dependent oxidoreductase [Coriobacteriia bacterium]